MTNKLNIKKFSLIGIAGILAISSIFMTVETATSGMEVSDLRNKEMILASEKRTLEDTLAKSLSVSSLEEKSTEMGYTKPTEMVYVSEPKSVAKLP
jgi:hypothetical protein